MLTGDEIRKATFRQTLRCYDIREVDQFLAGVADEVDAGRTIELMVRDARFQQKLRGYRPSDVDKLLDTFGRQ